MVLADAADGEVMRRRAEIKSQEDVIGLLRAA